MRWVASGSGERGAAGVANNNACCVPSSASSSSLARSLNTPKSWMLDKMGGVFAPKCSSGPHKGREAIPLVLVLRNRLKYALTRREAQAITMQKLVKVDSRVRTDENFPTGFMDVISIQKSEDNFRVMYDTKGRFVLHKVSPAEAKFKLARVLRSAANKKGIPTIGTHDGRTIRYPDPEVKVHDTVKVDLESGKVVDHLPFAVGSLAFITKGANTGRVGIITGRDKHPGSFDIVHIRDNEGNTFATRLGNVFVVGKGESPVVTLPRGQGIRRTIFEQRA